MPLTTPPVLAVPLYARDKNTGETYIVKAGSAAQRINDLTDVDTQTNPPGNDYILAFDATAGQWIPMVSTHLTGNYLPLDGGTLTGPLVANGTITANAGIAIPSGDRLDFSGTTLGSRIHLYDDSFGFAIQGGTLQYFVTETGNKHQFMVGTVEEAKVDQNGLWSQGSKVLTEASGAQIGRQKDGVAITTGTYYQVMNCGAEGSWRCTVAASGGGRQHIVSLSCSATVNGTGTASLVVDGNSSSNGKIFDQAIFIWQNNGYRISVRAALATTINVGWEGSDVVNANPNAVSDFTTGSTSYSYGSVGL